MLKKNISFSSIILIGALIFQVSIIPDSLNIRSIGRIVNIVILLILFSLLIWTLRHKESKKTILFYKLPIIIILVGYSINLIRSVDINSPGIVSIMLPWLAAITIPYVGSYSIEKSWRIFYSFMLITTIISLIEYYAVFNGFLTPSLIETSRGNYLKGVISIFYPTQGGDIPHHRFYGVFAEPGTYAMFLLPALTYALLFSKKLAALIFILAMYLTYSLGGFLGTCLLIIFYLLWERKRLYHSVPGIYYAGLFIVSLMLTISFYYYYSNIEHNLSNYYYYELEHRKESISIREKNVISFIHKFSYSLMKYPFGFELNKQTLLNIESKEDYYGSNFMFYNALVLGGILGFLGYFMFFLSAGYFSIKYFFSRHNPNRLTACVFITLPFLLTFCFQRTTILESMVFSFLFAVPLLEMIHGKRSSYANIIHEQHMPIRPCLKNQGKCRGLSI